MVRVHRIRMSSQESEMTSRRPSSSGAAPLEDDDLLSEILLRLPPEPSSLPRASLVCKRWGGLVSDPRFRRRFRLHHSRNPPLVGFFKEGYHQIYFVPAMDRVPHDPFSLQFDDGGKARFQILGCRHGLVLILHISMGRLLVWDPFTGYQHSFSVPQGFDWPNTQIHRAVVRAAGDAQHFQVVMVGTIQEKQHAPARASARVYSSETGTWGDLVSIPLPSMASSSMHQLDRMVTAFSGVLVGDSLYCLLSGNLLEFDLDRQRLAVIPVPVDMDDDGNSQFLAMRADGGGIGLLSLYKLSAQLWKRKTDCDGVASWLLERTIEMDKLLPLISEHERRCVLILGFAEENNVVLLWTFIGLFTVQLESLQFKKFSQSNIISCYIPFEGVYTAGTSVGGGHDGAELLHNT